MINEDKREELKNKYIGMTNMNYQGYEMTIVEYIKYSDVIIEFNDRYKTQRHCTIGQFNDGKVKNLMHPSVFNVGTIGDEYDISINRKNIKEYDTWYNMIRRCYDVKQQERNRGRSYKDCTVCDDWLYYPNFYRWLHSQDNFIQWKMKTHWSIDKDIIKKGNKIYSPDTCCLVPDYINSLFMRCINGTTNLPIGVYNYYNKYKVYVNNTLENKKIYLGLFNTIEEAFFTYKKYKEDLIKQVAKIEYTKGNIIEKCYNSMMNYQIEITD